MDWKTLNAQVIAEFRANQGKVAQFGDLPVVILHTRGAKTGRLLEVPLVLIIEEDGTWRLFGSAAGSQSHPAWVHNVRAHPEIDMEYGTETFRVRITETPADEARLLAAQMAQQSEQFAGYVKAAAPREIPTFTIERL